MSAAGAFAAAQGLISSHLPKYLLTDGIFVEKHHWPQGLLTDSFSIRTGDVANWSATPRSGGGARWQVTFPAEPSHNSTHKPGPFFIF